MPLKCPIPECAESYDNLRYLTLHILRLAEWRPRRPNRGTGFMQRRLKDRESALITILSIDVRACIFGCERFLKAHLQDLVDTVNFYGEKLSERVRSGIFSSGKTMEARNKLAEQIRMVSEK